MGLDRGSVGLASPWGVPRGKDRTIRGRLVEVGGGSPSSLDLTLQRNSVRLAAASKVREGPPEDATWLT